MALTMIGCIRKNKLDTELNSNKSFRSSAMKCVVPDLVKYSLFLLEIVEIVTLYFIRFEIYIHSFIILKSDGRSLCLMGYLDSFAF